MPCKIEIKRLLTEQIEERSNPGFNKTFEDAKVLASDLNKEYRHTVVSFYKSQEDYLDRKINIPDTLVDVYYNYELGLEQGEQAPEVEEKDVILDEGDVMLQSDEMIASIASADTLAKVEEALTKMGVNTVQLEEYLKGNPGIYTKGINGLADLAKGTIAIAQGRENVALTEEMVHMATAILEQNNPKLITEMISKIGNYKIYKETYDTYSKLKSYQLENGKPDIRKIKKEAVDKLIAELIIHNSEGSTQFPELLEENNRNMVQRWWDNIMESIRTLFGTTEVDLFNETAKQIIGEELIGTISDINTEGVYLQQDNNKNVIGNNSVVDTYFDIIDGEAAKMNFYEKDELTTNPKRHYTYDGVDVEYSVTEYLDKGKKPLNRTEEQVAEDNMKKEWGSEGHRYLEEHLKVNLIDSNGFRRSFPGVTPISSTLEDSVVEKIEAFAEELINSYPEGTRFLVEKMVVNKKVKGMRASKIDFIALVPVENKKGEKDIKVDILDWKFTSIDKRRQEDIHTSKMKAWVPQMGEYVNIMYNYGVSRNQLGKNRMIPLIMNYDSIVPGMASQGVYASSIEIGNVDSTKEKTLYLLPVPTPSESTGNIKVDELVASLKQQWEKVYKTPGKPEDKLKKDLNLNFLAKAIRFLHVKHDFGPLSRVGVNFLEDAEKVLEDFENIDYSKLGVDEINAKLDTILTLRNTAEKYISIDEVFISKYPKDTLDAEQNEVLTKLSRVAKSTERMLTKIDNVQTEFAIQLAVKKGMNLNTYEDAEGNTRIAAEKEITGLVKSFSEGTKLPAKLIKLATGLIMQSKNVVDIIFNRQSKEYSKILADLEKVAQSRGTTAFDMIATMDEKGLKLIKKLDSKFYKDVEKAIKDKDKKFFIDNMDLDAYNALVDEKLAKDYAILDKTKFVEEEEENNMIIAYRKKLLKDSLDISSKSFDGYNTYMFKVFFAQTRKEEKHYSPAYKKMAAIPEALAVWEFFTELNKKAKDMGYLDKEGSSFFPLMEATTLQKFAQTDNPLAQGKDFFADLYSVNINEQQNYSKIDPETGKLKKVVPTYFKKTDKNINQLSKDLNKVGLVWMKTLMDYQSTKELEFTLLTLQEVEKSKGSLMVDEKGDIIFNHGVAQINEKQNKNAELFETIINDAVYKIKQDLGSIGNKQISSAAKKATSDTEDLEAVESKEFVIKKTLNNADTLVRALAVGLKPMITAANYFGNNLHAFIQAGNFYKYREFFNNNKKLMASMSVEEKALLHLTAPFTDNLLTEKIREGATSVKSYLSTWSFSDVMMITNSFPERKLQYANAMSFNDNAMIVDGKIVNIRQYLRAKDRETKYAKDSSGKYLMSEEERKKLEDSFQERVDALKESSNIYKSVRIDETTGDISLEGVTDEELAKYRITITEYGRTLSGQMSEENKANFKRDALLTSFMMFKTWIPKLLTGRIQNVNKNEQSGDWEYGRTRAFLKVISYSWKDSVSNISDIIAGNENGLKIMSDILEDKRIQHFKSTGQELEITDEEFYDLMRAEIKRELRELTALATIIGFVAAIGAAQPPEEASDLEKNHYKYLTKVSSKILDELSFYYNPISLEAITRGSVLPSIGLLSKLFKFGKSLGELGYGEVVGDEKMVKDAHPLKYFLNMVPGGYQIMTEVVPFVWPETAKEMGVRVTGESRQK